MKSSSLAMSLFENEIDVNTAVRLSRIEEDYQMERFGEVFYL